MFDDQLLDELESSSVEVRKQAVKRLAQTKDRAALAYLADVYRNDPDPDVRELARKGGLYIKKHAVEDVAPPVPSLYDDDDDEPDVRDAAPLPSEIYVSQGQIEKAEGFVKQALDMHMRGDNERATSLLSRALKANPRLVHDAYTLSLAATVTGLPGPTAMQMLAPSADELSKRKAAPQQRERPGGLQSVIALAIPVAAAVVLVGYLLFPWFDIGGMTVEGLAGSDSTLATEWDRTIELMLEIVEAEIDLFREAGAPVPENITERRDALTAIHWDVTGLNTTLLTTGGLDTIDAFGLGPSVEGPNMGGLGLDAEIEALREPLPANSLDYGLFLVPLGGLLALILGFVLMMRQSLALWGLVVVAGLMAVIPMGHFFTLGEPALREKINWEALVQLPMPEQSLVAVGFWVAIVGALTVVVLPFAAMLSIPSPAAQPDAAADRL